ncbi:PD-(D/E)XK nuclease family protein [Eoetvoesiella caeni]
MFTESTPISLDELSGLPSTATLVLTVNNRYARRILADLSVQLDAQRQVMSLPDIVPLSAWLQQASDQLSFIADSGLASHTVDAFGARCLWQKVILEAEPDRVLLDVGLAARLAQDADRLASEWQLQVPPEMETSDYQRFKVWRQAYRQSLQSMDAEDSVLGFERVHEAIAQGVLPFHFQHLVLAGFNELAPRLSGLVQALLGQGVSVHALRADEQPAAALQRIQASDPDTEWRLAAHWAQTQLRANPGGRYAIVAASLESDVVLAHRVLREALRGTEHEPALPYNVAVARPLADWPLVRAALAWLRLLHTLLRRKQCEPKLAGEALLAGGCVAHAAEAAGRALIDAAWRRKAVVSVSKGRFEEQLAQWTPRLAQAWSDCLAMAADWRDGALDAWVQRFRSVLQALGFPGEAMLDSHAYQVVETLDRAFDRLARQSAVLGSVDFGQAVALLARLARETPFQPQRDPAARLDVQGFLEAEGGRWDGVWILGLTDEVLPASPKPNPLIPLAALRQADAPRATPERELKWAQDLYGALLRCAPQVWVSHALHEGERELRPSPCIENLAAGEAPPLPSPSQPCELEFLRDEQGPPLAQGSQTRGGIAVIDTQARNPLWAFVKYRLGASELADYAVLSDQNARGLFLHEAIEFVWRSVDSQEALARQHASGELLSLAEQAIQNSAEQHLRDYSPVLRELEVERARVVLESWFELELKRQPFAIEGVERSFQWTHGALDLTLRLDRIDKLDDGRLAVIDYKTGGGNIDPKSNWMRTRPIGLQLPFYASVLAREDARVGALVLARLHARKVEVKGLADGDYGLEGLAALDDWPEFAGRSWQQLMADWRHTIEGLAQEYSQGVAVNRSLRADDIKYCDTLPFLRLNEEVRHDV